MMNARHMRRIFAPSCNHLDRIAGALGLSLRVARKLLNQPRFPSFFCFELVTSALELSGISLSESSESWARRDLTLPTSLSPKSLFLFLTLSRAPDLGSSPFPAVRFRSRFRFHISLMGEGVAADFIPMCSMSGVSAGKIEVSVIAGLDSASETSDIGTSWKRFCGVVNAGFRNAGPDGLFCSCGEKNEACGGAGWSCLSGELLRTALANGSLLTLLNRETGVSNEAMGKGARSVDAIVLTIKGLYKKVKIDMLACSRQGYYCFAGGVVREQWRRTYRG